VHAHTPRRYGVHRNCAAIAIMLLVTASASADDRPAMKTLTFESGERTPASATICAASWLAGHWQWSGPDALSEEIWAPALDGTLMGSYRSIKGGKTAFYEMMLITEEQGSLVLRLRHFHPQDLRGWEQENGVAATLRLVQRDDAALYFDGLTFESVRPDLLRVHLRVVDPQSQQLSEKHFDYHKLASLPPGQQCP
jgi:hypothetical protein